MAKVKLAYEQQGLSQAEEYEVFEPGDGTR